MTDDHAMQKMRFRRFFAVVGATAVCVLAMMAGAATNGTSIARADTAYSHSADYECGSGYYENSNGSCTKGPDSAPSGIRCEDGTFSHARTTRGACSSHGGISDGSGGESSAADAGSLALGSLAVGGLLGLVLGSSVLGAGLLGSS